MDVCHSAFNAILHSIEEGGIQAHTWTFLATLFGDEMIKSTKELLSKETITLNIAQKSRRFIWTITSPKNSSYIWMNNSLFFCSCPSFYFRTLNNGKSPFCKHILAAYICDAGVVLGQYLHLYVIPDCGALCFMFEFYCFELQL